MLVSLFLFFQLYESICRVRETIASWEPDLIILSTPHGFNLTHALGVYLGAGAEGGAADSWAEFRVCGHETDSEQQA